MSVQEGTKMLYCKVAGDKSTEEVVYVISVHSGSAGGGVTIYIPSLKRERDTEVSRLSHIVEKKDKIDNYFGKPRLELPEISQEAIICAPTQRCTPDGKNPICLQIPVGDNWMFSADYTFYSKPIDNSSLFMSGGININPYNHPNCYLSPSVPFHNFNGFGSKIVVGVKINILIKFSSNFDLTTGNTNRTLIILINDIECVKYEHSLYVNPNQYIRIGNNGIDALVENLKITIPNVYNTVELTMQNRDEVLLDNQRLLFNQLNALQETIKILQRKSSPPADEELQREIAELRKMNTHHRQMNAQLLSSQREMREEMIAMRAEMAELKLSMKSAEKPAEKQAEIYNDEIYD